MPANTNITSSILNSPIMIVDDSAISRRKLKNDLTEKGFTNISEAVSGEDALVKLADITPALFLFDMLMPGMNGNELVKCVRRLDAHKTTPIIIVTVSEEEELIKECYSLGANDFLRKPWVADELSTRVSSQIERQQNIHYLTNNQTRLTRALEIITEGIWEYNLVTNEISLNPYCYKILNLDKDKVITLKDIQPFIHPEDISRIRVLFSKAMESKKTIFDFECRISLNKTTYRWLSTRAKVSEYNRDGSAKLIVGISKDITSQIVAQKHLQKFGKEMRDLAEERSQIIIHNERLVELGTMSAGIAHEINNPLSYIRGNIQLLMKTIPNMYQTISQEDISPEVKEKLSAEFEAITSVLSSLKDGIYRVCNLTTTMKNFASKNSDKGISDIALAINDALQLCNCQLMNGIKICKNYREGEYLIPINSPQITQVLMNLIINATQAMHEHGTLTISTSASGGYLVLKVEDTGSGVPDSIKNKIFDTFYTTKKEGEGTGLGLSISKDIVKEHHGKIIVENSEHTGAIFSVFLPLSTGADGSPILTIPEPEEADSINELTILIAEDDVLIQEVIAQKLKVFSCNTVTCSTVYDTIAKAKTHSPDAIALSMSGTAPESIFEIIKELAAEKIFTPIFIMQGEHSNEFPLEELKKEVNLDDFESIEIVKTQDIGSIFR